MPRKKRAQRALPRKFSTKKQTKAVPFKRVKRKNTQKDLQMGKSSSSAKMIERLKKLK